MNIKIKDHRLKVKQTESLVQATLDKKNYLALKSDTTDLIYKSILFEGTTRKKAIIKFLNYIIENEL